MARAQQRVVVTGTGRCGTGSAARFYGIGHEQVFTPYGPSSFVMPDSSWMAAPYMKQIKLPVIHLVRNPLDVVNSFIGINFFSDGEWIHRHGMYRAFAKHWCPEAFEPDDPVRRACEFYLRWNRMIGGDVVRVEDLTDIRVNQRPRSHLTWDDIPELHQIARDYGYRDDLVHA